MSTRAAWRSVSMACRASGWSAAATMTVPMTDRSLSVAHSSGLILIEVLVSLVLVLIGLIGLVSLQARAHQGETEAYQRTQAMVLLRHMASSIEAHRQAARC